MEPITQAGAWLTAGVAALAILKSVRENRRKSFCKRWKECWNDHVFSAEGEMQIGGLIDRHTRESRRR
jgi:hypothetical protein